MGCSCFKLLLWIDFFWIHAAGGAVRHHNKITERNLNDGKNNSTLIPVRSSIRYRSDARAFFFLLSGARPLSMEWTNQIPYQRPIAANDSASLRTAAPETVAVLIFRITFLFFFCLWMVSSHSGGQRKTATRSICPWLTPVNQVSAGWESSFGEGRGGGPPLLPYLSFSFTASLCLLVWLSLSLTFYSPHPLLGLTWITLLIELTPRLQTFPSFLGIRCSPPYCLPYFTFPPLIIPGPAVPAFLPKATKMNSTQGAVQTYSVHMLTCISLFTVSPVCSNRLDCATEGWLKPWGDYMRWWRAHGEVLLIIYHPMLSLYRL